MIPGPRCERCGLFPPRPRERGPFRLCFFCMQETVWHPANAKITASAQLRRRRKHRTR